MAFSFIPKEEKFFELFEAQAVHSVAAAKLFREMAQKWSRETTSFDRLREIEHEADITCHDIYEKLNRTFVTPFDRDQINKLIQRMDDILDLMQDTAESLTLYDVHVLTPEVSHLADLVHICCTRVHDAVTQLSSMDNGPAILKICQEIDALESDADRVMQAAISRLFREEQDLRQLVKLKAIYELLELTTDKCQDVALVIEGVVLENG